LGLGVTVRVRVRVRIRVRVRVRDFQHLKIVPSKNNVEYKALILKYM
jgi:hypothetical protein